jgi:putative transposon-encoded protein
MKKVEIKTDSKLVLTNIEGFVKRKVVPFGNSAKVSCPKEYLGREVYLVFVNDGKN